MPPIRLSLVLATLIGAHTLPAGEHGNPPPPPRPPEGLFKAFDADGNGSISREEFGAGLHELAQRNRPGDGGDRPRPPGGGEGDRPRPPGGDGGDRPRPPAGGDHPRPPAGGDRPRPPGGDGGDRPHPPAGADGEGPRRPTPHGDGPQPPLDPAEREARITEAFNAGDADKNGTLSPPEFKAAMEAMPKPPHPPQDKPKKQGD